MFGTMAQELESKPKVIVFFSFKKKEKRKRRTEKGGAKCVLTIWKAKLSL